MIQTSRAAVVASPKSASAWGKLGLALQAAEFHRAAQICYSNAAVLDQNNFRWPYLLGLLELQDAPDEGIRHLSRAAELAGGSVDGPRFQLSRALIERGQTDQAAPLLQQLLAAYPEHAAAHVELARVYLARGQLREATHELQPALTNHLTMRPALFLAAQIAQRNGQPETATQLSRRAASLPRAFDWPDPVLKDVQSLRIDREKLADQANALIQQQRLSDAEALVEKLLNAFPDDAEGLLLLGRLRYLERRCPEAETVLRRHLAVHTNSLNGFIQLSLSLLCQQKWTNAAAVLERAIALKPDFAQAHNNLGLARSRAGDSAGAIRAYRDALRCNPGDVNAHIALAEELANAGQLAEAREHVSRAAEINPNDTRLRAAREQLGLKE
jgi:tetratricopeptide (TPR) repeat protein